jgi:hypothetical protein
MLQQWNIRSCTHECAVTGRPFEDGEKHYTAIYFDTEANGYMRRDVSLQAWEQELSERKPFSFWKSVYVKHAPEARPEIASKESAMGLLQRLIEEDESYTENARYILALMLERKRILSPTAAKETEQGRMLFYENKKTGEAFVIRDPELRLDEIEGLQEEVATLLGFGARGAEPPAKAAKPPAPEAAPEPPAEEAPAAPPEAPVEEQPALEQVPEEEASTESGSAGT